MSIKARHLQAQDYINHEGAAYVVEAFDGAVATLRSLAGGSTKTVYFSGNTTVTVF